MVIDKFEGEFAFLSNSYPSTFFYQGIKYKSVTQAYYALKAKNEADSKKIRDMKDVSEIVRYGKTIVVKDDWQSCCRQIMKDLLLQKFDNPFLSERLLKTTAVLGNGRNFVGELLMEVRKELTKSNDDQNDKNGRPSSKS